MKKVLFILLIGMTIVSCSKSNETEIVNDFVFKSINDLTTKYNHPEIDSITNRAEWHLDNNLIVTVFYRDKNLILPEVIRFKNLDVDYEIFYYDLGWDLPHLDWQPAFGKTKTTELYGMKEATYHRKANILSIVLDEPVKSTFGKRK
ncbi:MAG: hypothetical protein PSN34_06385 [Urechidicola sp.]|nr:hypothetical protein [Urechidicola sp.]